MNDRHLDRLLGHPATVPAGAVLTLAIGLVFVYAWAPHPWGLEGFDHYHQLALTLAHGYPFPTMEVPWGYAYFLAIFYRVFGDRPEIPLTVQVLLNAGVPVMTFAVARAVVDRRTAVLASLLCAVFSFNTVYASTQSSDAVCTVLFMTAVAWFASAARTTRVLPLLGIGLLTGLAAQFRPNLILVPGVFSAWVLWPWPTRARVVQAGALVLGATAALAPWVVRNYQLTGTVIPTSVHGGVQLWYGTLQVGPYLNSRAYNPQSVFESPTFAYTSLADVPIVVTGRASTPCLEASLTDASLVYWTDADTTRRAIPLSVGADKTWQSEIPAPRRPAVVYYFVDAHWRIDGTPVHQPTPAGGAGTPLVYFVSQDHVGDLDVHGDLLDIFDVVRLARHLAWQEPLPWDAPLRQAGLDLSTLDATVRAVLHDVEFNAAESAAVARMAVTGETIRIRLPRDSEVTIPRAWTGRVTDLGITGELASRLLVQTVPLSLVRERLRPMEATAASRCVGMVDLSLNAVFYRSEPHMMRRYSALSLDNIRRTPVAFAAASAYRAVRLFVIAGTSDVRTAQQFDRSRLVYTAGTVASATYALLLAAGVLVAWRRGASLGLPLLLILYVPATIAPVLTNQRYTVTVQPLAFIFVAVAVSALLERWGWLGRMDQVPEASGREGR